MSFCSKCGSQLEEGDVFCANCGNRTESNGQAPSPQVQHPVNTVEIGEYFKEILSIVLGIFSKPATTIKYAAKNFKNESAYILAGIIVLLQSLLSLLSFKQTIGTALNSLQGALGIFGGLMGGLEPSYGKVFVVSLLSTIILIVALSGIIFLMGKYAFKGEGDFLSVFKVVTCSYIPYVGLFLAAIILTYISPVIGQVAMVGGLLSSIILIFIGIMEAMNFSDDKAVFTFTTAIMIIILIAFIILNIYVRSKIRSIGF